MGMFGMDDIMIFLRNDLRIKMHRLNLLAKLGKINHTCCSDYLPDRDYGTSKLTEIPYLYNVKRESCLRPPFYLTTEFPFDVQPLIQQLGAFF